MVSRGYPVSHRGGVHCATEPHAIRATQLRPIRNSLGWQHWVLTLTAKERNQVIAMYQLTDSESTRLKKSPRRTKRRESQKRCVLRKRKSSASPHSDMAVDATPPPMAGYVVPGSRIACSRDPEDSATNSVTQKATVLRTSITSY